MLKFKIIILTIFMSYGIYKFDKQNNIFTYIFNVVISDNFTDIFNIPYLSNIAIIIPLILLVSIAVNINNRRLIKLRLLEFGYLYVPLLVFKVLNNSFKKDTYLLFDSFYDENVECVDSYSLFMYMQKHGIKSYYVLWRKNILFDELKHQNKLNNVILLDITYQRMKFLVTTFSVLLKTKVVITSFGGLPPLLRRYLYNNKHIQHVHIGHGKTLLKNSGFLTDYLSAKEYNKFVVASDLEKEIFINNGWHENNIIKAGLPRWDLLENNKTKDRSIFFMVTWRQSFKRMYEKKYVGNMQESDYIKKISSFLSSELLMNLMEKHKVTFFFSLHHSIIKQVQDFPGFTMNPYVKFIRSTSISRCVQSCGMFITDYSSVAFDFLFLDKPVIFYRPDYFDYNLLSIDRYDMENAKKYDDLLFNIFYDDKGLFDKIEYYINNGFCLEDIYKTKSKIFFDRKKDIRGKIVEMLEYTVT